MQSIIIQMVMLLHAAFGCVFLFLYRQHPLRFSRLMAQSWLLEAFRAGITLTQLADTGGWMNHWYSLSDCLGVVAAWWLLGGCADLVGVRLPARLGRYYIGISLPLILALRYLAPGILHSGFNLPLEQAGHLSVLIELVIVFVPVTLARVAILFWFIRMWRQAHLPGALLAVIFGVPYVVFALINPVQFSLNYYPDWISFLWAARVLGFSLGLVMLLFDKQLAAQREGELAYRTIVETSHDLIWSVDAEGRWTFVNAAARGIYGYEPKEMLGRPFTDFETPEQAKKDLVTFAQIKAGTSAFNYETEHRHKDGMPVWLSFNAVVLRDKQGNMLGTTGTAQDITARIQAETVTLAWKNRYEAAIKAHNHLLYDWDPATNAVIYGGSLSAILGYTAEDMSGGLTHWLELVHPEDRAGFSQEVERMKTTKSSFTAEYRVRRADGTYIVVHDSGHFVLDAAGQITRMVGFVMDITERKHAEVALRQSEERFRRIMESDMTGMLFWNTAGGITAANNAFLRIVGYTQEDVQADRVDWRKMTPPEFLPLDENALREIAATGVCTPFEKEYFRQDGSRVPVLVGGASFPEQPGEGVAYVIDNTQRKAAEAAHAQALSLTLATLESTADGILVVNAEGKIVTYNQVFARMWQIPEEVLAAKDDARAIQCVLDQLSEPEKFIAKVRHLYVHPQEESSDTLTFKDGRVFERYSRPQHIDGQVVGRVWSFRDTTGRKRAEQALQVSEEKFHALYAQSPLAIVLTTHPEGRVTDANEAAERLLGHKLADARGQTTTELGIWVDLADRDRYLQQLHANDALKGFEARIRRHDDVEIIVLYHGRVIRIGDQAYVLNSLLDITDRKKAEEELRLKQVQLLAVLRIARLAYWELDIASGLFTFNDQFYALLRTTAEREGGYTMPAAQYARRFIHPEDGDLVRTETGKAVASTDPYYEQELDHRIIYADGEVGYFNVRIRVEKDAQGRTIKTSGANMDITWRKQAEEQVRHLAAFPELNPNPVLEFSDEGALVYHNPAALGMARKVGVANLEQLLPSATRSIVVECLASGQPRLRLETKQGRHTLSWSFFPIASQRVVHCYVGDITDRQSLEEQLRQAQKMEAIGQLAGGVAHDFNNMLTAIIGHIGLLRDNPKMTPEIDESLGEISAAANRAANLTSQLLAFSRRQVISASALDLNEVVTHLTKMLRRILGEQIIMQLDYAPEQLTFHGDAGLMEQVLVNLAVNARDAMPEGGTLRIVTRSETRVPPVPDGQTGASEPAAFVRLSVSDTGTGIPPEIREKIFEPFFTTKDVGKGTGLGLATVFGIVQQHHGWIEVESAMGRGTVFHLFLPRLAAAPTALTIEPIAPPGRGKGELVLLVEDEPSVQELGKLALTRFGYRVLTASNGREALAVWAQHQAEIVLLLTDMIMPEGISGQQLARQLLGEKPTLKVIYSSGYNAEIAGKELKLQDGVNYLAKPYELDRLFRTVRAALDGRQSRPHFAES